MFNSDTFYNHPDVCRIYGNQAPYNAQEAEEFKQMLKDRPEVKKHYETFLMDSCQSLRSRIGGGIFWDRNLDVLFEIAAVSGITPDDKPTKSLAEQRQWQKMRREKEK